MSHTLDIFTGNQAGETHKHTHLLSASNVQEPFVIISTLSSFVHKIPLPANMNTHAHTFDLLASVILLFHPRPTLNSGPAVMCWTWMTAWAICSFLSFCCGFFFFFGSIMLLFWRMHTTTWGLAVFPALDIKRRIMIVGGQPSNLPVPLAPSTGQLVLSATLTDDLLSGCF